jgi:hypothetical protein
MNEMLLRDKLNEIKLFEKIKLNEIEIFNQLINFNRKIDSEFRSRISRSRKETELYTRIFESHRFFCLLYDDFSWVHHFFNYLENVLKNNEYWKNKINDNKFYKYVYLHKSDEGKSINLKESENSTIILSIVFSQHSPGTRVFTMISHSSSTVDLGSLGKNKLL